MMLLHPSLFTSPSLLKEEGMLIPAASGPASHLLQRVAQFNPLPLHRRLGWTSGRVGIAAQSHLV